MAWAISQDVQPDHDMECFRRPTRAELVEVYREAERFAPIPSEWAGYEIPWCLAWVVAQRETNHINSCDNCHGGGPGNARSAGYFGIGVPAARRWYVTPQPIYSPRYSSEEVCDFLVARPRAQVHILFRMAAYYLRANGGNLYSFFSIWRTGQPEGTDYAAECRAIWRARFPWPRDGRLTPLHRHR